MDHLDSQELAEQMAYDLLQNTATRERLEGEIEVENSKKLSREDRAAMFRRMLGA